MLPAKKDNHTPARKSAFTRALDRLQNHQREVRIALIIDATGSRSETWEQAQVAQARMFRSLSNLGKLSLRLIHFGGDEITDHGWSSDPRSIAASMAAVRCRRGLTQFIPAMKMINSDTREQRAHAQILVGDCFEEDWKDALLLALAMRANGTRTFAFHEGEDRIAADTLERLATGGGGSFARLGDELPLADLCEGVALLTTDGKRGLKRLGNAKARQLLLTGPDKE